MATISLRSKTALSAPFVCSRCSLQLKQPSNSQRWLHSSTSWRSKTPSQPRASLRSESQSMLAILEKRGYINQIAGTRDELDSLMTRKRVGAYVGIDPTASSMHVGHLIPFMALFWMYLHGYKAVTLLGGATAGVGDPTGRSTARIQQSRDARLANTKGIEAQIQRLWKNVAALAEKHNAEFPEDRERDGQIFNNDHWLQKISIMDVLATIGAGLRLGPLLGRDTVKTRMESSDGMSFSEFCYPVLQAWDWWHMFRTNDIQIQIGGADQYGNILSGVDAIKHAAKAVSLEEGTQQKKHDPLKIPMGFTVPLLTTPSGEKFGKSAGNAVWLDKEQTSVFDLYGFFVSQPDADVERLLKFFTFLPISTIHEIMTEHVKTPEKRVAQHRLAREFVELVHGPEEADGAERQHRSMFSQSQPKIGDILTSEPDAILPLSMVLGKPFPSILWNAGLVGSKSEGSRLVKKKGAYVLLPSLSEPAEQELSFAQIEATGDLAQEHHILEAAGSARRTVILRSGKRKLCVVDVVSDEEFEKSGLDAPGWKENGSHH